MLCLNFLLQFPTSAFSFNLSVNVLLHRQTHLFYFSGAVDMTPRRNLHVEGLDARGPFRREGWFKDNEWGLASATREADYDQYHGGPWDFAAVNNALPANYATRHSLMLRESNHQSRGTSLPARLFVDHPVNCQENQPLYKFRSYDFTYSSGWDAANNLDRVRSRMNKSPVSKLSHRRNSRSFNREQMLFGRSIYKHRANMPGRFCHLSAQQRRSVRRKCRRTMAKKGEEQVATFVCKIRRIIEENPIEYCDFSPLVDFIDAMRDETTDNFRRWLFSVSSLESDMELTEPRLNEYGSQYRGMKMRYHAAFCAVLTEAVVSYEKTDPSSFYHMRRAEKMARQYRNQRGLFDQLLSDPASKNFLNGLQYGTRGEVLLRAY